MIPSWDVVVDIWIIPLVGVEVEHNDVVVLTLGVPTTVAIDFSADREESVTSSWFRGVVQGFNFLPVMCI